RRGLPCLIFEACDELSRVEGVGFKGPLYSNFLDLLPSRHDQTPGHCAGIHTLVGSKPHFRHTRCGHNPARRDGRISLDKQGHFQ
ncbi:MAG: hypothetical protein ABII06_07305, partial [Pseudomonadota bacterium]